MLTKWMKRVAIAALLLTALWLSFGNYQLMLGAALSLALFVPSKVFLWLNLSCLVAFTLSCAALKGLSRALAPSHGGTGNEVLSATASPRRRS